MTARQTGRLGEILQRHKDETGYDLSDAKVAKRIGISASLIANWRSGNISRLPDAERLQKFAQVTNTPYSVVIEAALYDAGYRDPERTTRESVDETTRP